MDCCGIRDSIYQFVDNELEREVANQIEQHLAHCPHCARRRQFTVGFLILIRRRVVRHAAPAEVRRRLVGRLSVDQERLPRPVQ